MNSQALNRDSSGRFRPAGYVDPVYVKIAGKIAQENAVAEHFLYISKVLGDPGFPKRLGMTRSNGNWYVPLRAAWFFRGLVQGLDCGLRAATIPGAMTTAASQIKDALEHIRA